MFRIAIAAVALIATFGSSSAAEMVTAESVRPTIAGKTIQIATPIGKVPVSFRPDGSMTGGSQGLASYAMSTSDRGRWWVSGNKLCQQWQSWFDKATHCFELRREGRTLYWSGSGRSGVATISNRSPAACRPARTRLEMAGREVSSAVERFVYTEDVGGSIPSPPTMI